MAVLPTGPGLHLVAGDVRTFESDVPPPGAAADAFGGPRRGRAGRRTRHRRALLLPTAASAAQMRQGQDPLLHLRPRCAVAVHSVLNRHRTIVTGFSFPIAVKEKRPPPKKTFKRTVCCVKVNFLKNKFEVSNKKTGLFRYETESNRTT